MVREHSAFLKRQRLYEVRFQKLFFRYLRLVYYTAANTIENVGVDAYMKQILARQHKTELDSIYRRLYTKVTLDEAAIQEMLLEGAEMAKKDLIDDISSAFPFTGGAKINIFRQLLKEYLTIRIGQRITEVTQSTVKFVAEAIEKGIAEGLGNSQIAKLLREKTDFNKNRALVIARTETVTASNQGKFMSALSANLVYEKRWIPTNQPGRTRRSHLAMLNTPFIDLDEPFLVPSPKLGGGVEVARYPGDESLSAGNSVNCRCSIGFRVKRDKEGNPLRRIF